jgi:hypothetical protein
MRTRAMPLASVLTFALAISATAWASDMSPGWETIRSDAGIQVSRKVVPGSSFVAFRGEGDVNAPLLSVANVLVDVPHEKDWMDGIKEARVLRQVSDTEYILYSHLGTPPTMTDREFVTDVRVAVDPSKRGLTVDMHSVDDPSAPRTDYVRAVLTESSFTLHANPDGKTTHVVAEIHCDPKGTIPSWAVNFFQRSWGFNTLQSLRRQVARGTAPAQPLLQDRLVDGRGG